MSVPVQVSDMLHVCVLQACGSACKACRCRSVGVLPAGKALCEHFAFPAHHDPAKCGGVGMFDSALAFFEEGSLLVWAVRRSRVSLAFGIA